MDDYNENNINQYDVNPEDVSMQKDQEHNRPEYSFWAEKVSGPLAYEYYQEQEKPTCSRNTSRGSRF